MEHLAVENGVDHALGSCWGGVAGVVEQRERLDHHPLLLQCVLSRLEVAEPFVDGYALVVGRLCGAGERHEPADLRAGSPECRGVLRRVEATETYAERLERLLGLVGRARGEAHPLAPRDRLR